MKLLAVLLTASVVSIACPANCSAVCSLIANPSCRCADSSSPASPTVIRCTFNTSQPPSPLFPNSSIAGTITVDTLDLSDNDLDDLPDEFFNNEAVDTLVLKRNRFGDLPGVLGKLRAVKTVDLSFNALRSLSLMAVGSVSGLQSLDVSSNEVTSLSADDLQGGEAAVLPGLKELSLARNDIQSLNGSTLGILTGLQALDLAHNHLSQVTSDTFWGLRYTLNTLDLSNNTLSAVDRLAFRSLQRIHSLNLAGNDQVGSVLDTLQFPQHLTSLNLKDCGLESVNRCQLSRLSDLDVLDLRGNPLNCTCELFLLYQQFQSQGADHRQWTCREQTLDTAPVGASPAPSLHTSQSQTSTASTADGGQIAVADLRGQCQGSYTVCPSVSELVDQIVTTVDVQQSENSLLVSWTLELNDDRTIDGFQLRYIPEAGDSLTSRVVPPQQRALTISTGDLAEHFMVCLDVLMYTSAVVHQNCQSFQEKTDSMVVGILAGVVFLAPCLVVLTYVFFKDSRITRARYEKVDSGEDVEKQNPLTAGFSFPRGEGGEVGVSPADLQGHKGAVPPGRDNGGVGMAQASVVRESDHPRIKESEDDASNVSTARPDTVSDQAGSENPPHLKGIKNPGFLCQGGHAGGQDCKDPEHELTHL